MVLKFQNHKIKLSGDSRLMRGSSTLHPDRKQSQLKVSIYLKTSHVGLLKEHEFQGICLYPLEETDFLSPAI